MTFIQKLYTLGTVKRNDVHTKVIHIRYCDRQWRSYKRAYNTSWTQLVFVCQWKSFCTLSHVANKSLFIRSTTSLQYLDDKAHHFVTKLPLNLHHKYCSHQPYWSPRQPTASLYDIRAFIYGHTYCAYTYWR